MFPVGVGCFGFFLKNRKKTPSASAPNPAAPPTAIPAIAPPDKGSGSEPVGVVVAGEAEERVGVMITKEVPLPGDCVVMNPVSLRVAVRIPIPGVFPFK